MLDIVRKGPGQGVAVVSTLDTKGRETVYLADRIREGGIDVLVVDCGVLGEPRGVTVEIMAREAGPGDRAHRIHQGRGVVAPTACRPS